MRRDGGLILCCYDGGQQQQLFPAQTQFFTDELTPIKTQANKGGEAFSSDISLRASLTNYKPSINNSVSQQAGRLRKTSFHAPKRIISYPESNLWDYSSRTT
ncbi:hypothetical protein PAMP_005202 [Pampus punctatissimus]